MVTGEEGEGGEVLTGCGHPTVRSWFHLQPLPRRMLVNVSLQQRSVARPVAPPAPGARERVGAPVDSGSPAGGHMAIVDCAPLGRLRKAHLFGSLTRARPHDKF